MSANKVKLTVNLSEEHVEILRVIVACGIAKDYDSAIEEALGLFKGLIHKYIQLLDCSCRPEKSERHEEDE